MTKWEIVTLVNDATPGTDTGTWVYQLPTYGSIQDLELLIEATNGPSGNANNPIMDCITKIEVRDGLFRHLVTAPALMLYKHRSIIDHVAPQLSQVDTANAVQLMRLPILFGRFKGDEKYGLEVASMSEPDVAVTYDLTKVRACGATGFVPGSINLTLAVTRSVNGERANFPSGVFTRIGVVNLTPSSGRFDYKIPMLNKLVSMTIYAYKSGTDDGSLITSVRLDENRGERTSFNQEWANIQQAQLLMTGSSVPYTVNVPVGDRGNDSRPFLPTPAKDLDMVLTTPVSEGALKVLNEYVEAL